MSKLNWPEPYASIQIDVNTGITVVDKPSHKTVEVYTRFQIEAMLNNYFANEKSKDVEPKAVHCGVTHPEGTWAGYYEAGSQMDTVGDEDP